MMKYYQFVEAMSADDSKGEAVRYWQNTDKYNAQLEDGDILVAALKNLLEVLEESSMVLMDNMNGGRQKVGFEVCLKDQLFQISVVCYNDPTKVSALPLSPRELEIARLITKGMPNKRIAYELGLQPSTVSTYTKRIYLKLNVNSRSEMVGKVLRDFSYFF